MGRGWPKLVRVVSGEVFDVFVSFGSNHSAMPILVGVRRAYFRYYVFAAGGVTEFEALPQASTRDLTLDLYPGEIAERWQHIDTRHEMIGVHSIR